MTLRILLDYLSKENHSARIINDLVESLNIASGVCPQTVNNEIDGGTIK